MLGGLTADVLCLTCALKTRICRSCVCAHCAHPWFRSVLGILLSGLLLDHLSPKLPYLLSAGHLDSRGPGASIEMSGSRETNWGRRWLMTVEVLPACLAFDLAFLQILHDEHSKCAAVTSCRGAPSLVLRLFGREDGGAGRN